MNIGATTAQNIYDYQSTLTTAGRASAVFQVLTQAYSQSSAAMGSSNDLATLAGQANLKPLISAIYTQGKAIQAAGGTADNGVQGLQASPLYGGVDSSAASSLLTQLFGDSASSLSSFGVGASTLSMVGADARKAYGSGNLTQAAQAQAAQTLNGSSSSSTSANAIQAAISAQMASINNTFTLLA